MNALSVFAGACAFFASAFVGLWLKGRLIKKSDFYKDYYAYLTYALEKIGYERALLKEINDGFQGKCKEFLALLRGENAVFPVSEKELSEVRETISAIGKSDADSQIASLSARCATLKRFLENDCVAFQKDAALRFKLSLLVGAALFIILA